MPNLDKEQLAILHEAYLECDGNWQTSEFVMELKKSSSKRTRGRRAYFTRKQLIEKYNEEQANDIIKRKMEDPELRRTQVLDNPDNPENPVSWIIMCVDVC